MAVRILAGLVLMSLLSGCVMVRGVSTDDNRQDGPEQFEFVMLPGKSDADAAEEIVGSAAGPGAESFAHVATMNTPVGRIDIWTWEGPDGSCVGVFEERGSSASCGTIEEGPMGWGSDGRWATVTVRVPDGTVTMVVTTTDGTEFTVQTVNGWGAVVFPVTRGEPSTAEYLDAQGNSLGSAGF
ncbi:MAG: hypothetical protein OEO77_13565 [Acidimicrobiia bacterium]|nr:hypothetical protein [Acidimicrobiia bacterium]